MTTLMILISKKKTGIFLLFWRANNDYFEEIDIHKTKKVLYFKCKCGKMTIAENIFNFKRKKHFTCCGEKLVFCQGGASLNVLEPLVYSIIAK